MATVNTLPYPLPTYAAGDVTGRDDIMSNPIILDTFCGGGGASVGYNRAGFGVVGIDIKPQPHYPFPFILGDALDILARMLQGERFLASNGQWYGVDDFGAIHASPPCQKFSKCQVIRNNEHPDLVGAIRNVLIEIGLPYVIENVPGAPLISPIMLAGTMFNLGTMRKRLFECSFEIPFFLIPPLHARHAKMGRLALPGEFVYVAGKGGRRGVNEQWKISMGIDWMTCKEIAQAIPPAYTEYIGGYLIRAIEAQR